MNNINKLIDFALTMVFYKKRVASLLSIPLRDVELLFKEINNSVFFRDIIQKACCPRFEYYLSMLGPYRAPFFYVLCRILKPKVIVETGVKDGFSSSFILFALEKNKFGSLFSIDLPNAAGQELKKQQSTGWLIPQDLRERWSIALGSSRDKLPSLLKNLGEIDIFYHDSDHSYENMSFEFNQSLNYIKPKGCLLSDDITDNKAFDDFIKSKNLKSSARLFRTGIILK